MTEQESNRKELTQLNESFASLKTKFNEIKAEMDKKPNMDSPEMQILKSCMAQMYGMMDNMNNRMDRMNNNMWNYQDSHAEGHIPKIIGADKMNKALKALGMDGDYEAKKKTLFAAAQNIIKVNTNTKNG